MFTADSSVTNHELAIEQVQNAVDYISRDAQMSETAKSAASPYVPTWDPLNPSALISLTFNIPASSDGINYSITEEVYQVSNGNLIRNGQIIATNIPTDGFTVNLSATQPYVSITSTITGLRSESETRTIALNQ
jgi:hypothetical protein